MPAADGSTLDHNVTVTTQPRAPIGLDVGPTASVEGSAGSAAFVASA
jgi:hypothetical protein